MGLFVSDRWRLTGCSDPRVWGVGAGVAVLTFVTATIATELVVRPLNLAPFWPSAGVGIGAILATGGAARIASLAGALAGLLACALTAGLSVATALVLCGGQALEFILIQQSVAAILSTPLQLDRLRNVLIWIVLTVVGVMVAAVMASVGLRLTGYTTAAFADLWRAWVASHVIGMVVVAPVFLALRADLAAGHRLGPKDGEAIAILASSVIVSIFLLARSPSSGAFSLAVSFAILFPLLLWAAARCRTSCVAMAALLVGLFAMFGVASGTGAFANPDSTVTDRVAAAQLFIFSIVFCALTLSAMMQERRMVGRALRSALESSSHQLDAILDTAASAILTIDASGTIRSVNAATLRLFGYDRPALVGHNVRRLMPEPEASRHDSYIQTYIDTGNARIIGTGREVSGRRQDGSTFPIHLGVSEFYVEGQRFFMGIMTDLSHRKAAEDKLRETERILSQAQKLEAIGQLTGGIAHDFNNLLTVIAGNLELLDMQLQDETSRDLLNRASAAARRGARLIERLSTFSRRGHLQPEVVNLNETAIGMMELMRRSLGENITMSTKLLPGLWTTRVDASQIENAILNLAINARDAMPNGGQITIETGNVVLSADEVAHFPGAAPGDYVRLAVSDTGVGMQPEVVSRAFEPFFTTKEDSRGTGLGLSTIYGLVRQSRGLITIDSAVGLGTTVSLYLPRGQEIVEQVAQEVSSACDGTPHLGARILIVEDNDEVRDLFVRRLSLLGYTTLIAGSAAAAIAQLETDRDIDMVLTDVVMPGGMSGYDLADWVANNRPNLAVLLTSGNAPLAPDTTVPGHGSRLLRKPHSQLELAQCVEETLQG